MNFNHSIKNNIRNTPHRSCNYRFTVNCSLNSKSQKKELVYKTNIDDIVGQQILL